MIHVIATIELQPGKRAEFLREFHRIVPLVLAEKGCLLYGPAVDVETGLAAQLPLRPDTVTVVEQWATLEDLHAHLVAPHMMEYRPRVKDLVIRTLLQVMEPV
jgi:quinol monooxygenase YgiN